MWRGAGVVGLTLMAVVSACGGSEAGLVEVQGVLGTLDCPSDLHQTSFAEIASDAIGSETADEAVARLTEDLGLPPGIRSREPSSDTPGRVVYTFSDSAGHRLGRAEVSLLPNGWFVVVTERCA